MKDQKLIFVYNASSGLFSTVTDFAHKVLSPSTYECHLCALTYGNISKKQEWKSFIEKLPVKSLFRHKNEFIKKYRIETEFPAIFIQSDADIRKFISRQEIEQCKTLKKLQDFISSKLSEHDKHHYTNVQ